MSLSQMAVSTFNGVNDVLVFLSNASGPVQVHRVENISQAQIIDPHRFPFQQLVAGHMSQHPVKSAIHLLYSPRVHRRLPCQFKLTLYQLPRLLYLSVILPGIRCQRDAQHLQCFSDLI